MKTCCHTLGLTVQLLESRIKVLHDDHIRCCVENEQLRETLKQSEPGETMNQNPDIVDRLQTEIVKLMSGEPDSRTYAVTTMARAKQEIVRLRGLVATKSGEQS